MNGNCYVCNENTNEWTDNMGQLKSQYSDKAIVVIIKDILDDYISKRMLEIQTGYICANCLYEIEDFDFHRMSAALRKQKIQENIQKTEQTLCSQPYGAYDIHMEVISDQAKALYDQLIIRNGKTLVPLCEDILKSPQYSPATGMQITSNPSALNSYQADNNDCCSFILPMKQYELDGNSWFIFLPLEAPLISNCTAIECENSQTEENVAVSIGMEHEFDSNGNQIADNYWDYSPPASHYGSSDDDFDNFVSVRKIPTCCANLEQNVNNAMTTQIEPHTAPISPPNVEPPKTNEELSMEIEFETVMRTRTQADTDKDWDFSPLPSEEEETSEDEWCSSASDNSLANTKFTGIINLDSNLSTSTSVQFVNLINEKMAIECQICSEVMLQDKFKAHEDWHKKKPGKNSQNPQLNISIKSLKVCEICDLLVSKHKSKRHQRFHDLHPGFCCRLCYYKLPDKPALINHRKIHDGPSNFSCFMCDKKCETLREFRRHITQAHNKERHMCEQCGKAFTRPFGLKLHSQIHSNERLAKCNLCPSAFKHLKNLKKHIQTVHSNERPYACSVCAMKFKRKDACRTHERRHTEDTKTEKCTICSAAFEHKFHLKQHIEKKHSTIPKS